MDDRKVSSRARPEISIVVPVYGCEQCLRALYERLVQVLSRLVSRFEIVLVDDRSPQADWRVIAELAARDARVRGIRLCRNFGQHCAIAAGLEHAEGDWVVVMDCDLQDPPEAIAQLYEKTTEGHQVVFARRLNRKDTVAKRAGSRAFSWLHGLSGGFRPDASVGNFSIIHRKVVLLLRGYRAHTRNYGVEVHWFGFPTAFVDVEHATRLTGTSAYTFRKQLRHAVATILSQSTKPLYASAGIGLSMSLGASVVAAYLAVRQFVWGYAIEGWTSVMVSLFFLFGVVIMNLGILGLYLGSVFLELKGRPSFVVEETTFAGEA
jgi:polyisoprenyl-phosphate glycosyltransferase